MRATEVQLTETEEEQLQRILAESFDISHPDFDQQRAMENLQRNFQGTVGLCKNCLHAKTKAELEQYDQYCQECYDEVHPTSSSEPEQASLTLTSSSTQTLDNSQEIIQLLQNQIMQQAQIIATLQEQAQTFKNQAQIIAHLQSKVEQFEAFHNRMRNLYCEALPFDDSMLSASSSNSSQNF